MPHLAGQGPGDRGGGDAATATTVFDVDLSKTSGVKTQQLTEAFDEPLGMDAVLKIAGMFIKS